MKQNEESDKSVQNELSDDNNKQWITAQLQVQNHRLTGQYFSQKGAHESWKISFSSGATSAASTYSLMSFLHSGLKDSRLSSKHSISYIQDNL